jgi:hypothetical protein
MAKQRMPPTPTAITPPLVEDRLNHLIETGKPKRRKDGGEYQIGLEEVILARHALLPAPTAQDSVGSRNRTSSRPPDSKHHDGITLTDAVWMGMLPTPQSYSQGNSKSMPGLTPLDIAVRPELAKHAERAKERRMGMLPTPRTTDVQAGRGAVQMGDGWYRPSRFLAAGEKVGQANLADVALMLPTPRSTDGEKGGPNQRGSKGDMALPMAVLHIDPTGSAGQMRLNPLLVSWMMGYPPGWLDVECPRSKPSATP